MLYKISLVTYFYQKNYFESFLEGVTDNVCSFEIGVTEDIEPQKMDKWIVEAYFEEKPEDIIVVRMKNYAEENELYLEDVKIIEVEEEDFASKVMMDFKPIVTGNFYIHNSYYQENNEENLISLHIDSGMAFGTGDHETTSGCLKLLESIEVVNKKVLDMGTGSGILAIAAAKLGAGKLIAVDIDKYAVETANKNIVLNKVEKNIMTNICNGYDNFVLENGPYDIILSNILARPLIEMAPMLYESLNQYGYCILAGFLEKSANEVIAAHEKLGLKLLEKLQKNDWICCLLRK